MSPSHHTALVWFRRDLRLADNPALLHALSNSHNVIPVFIHAPEEETPWEPGGASKVWLHNSLAALEQQLAQLGSKLIIRRGPTLAALQQLIADTGATLVCWNRLYEPSLIARDTYLKSQLKHQNIEVHSHNGALLFEPWTIRNKQDQPFKVFTPFWRHCQTLLDTQLLPLAMPPSLPAVDIKLKSLSLDELSLLPELDWHVAMTSHWRIGESGAHQQLQRFIDETAAQYAGQRDRPDCSGTSRLSPHLHFGEIGPRQILAALQAHNLSAEPFVRQLGWREFAHHLLFHFPHTDHEPMDARFASFTWQHNEAALKAWQLGRTGIPLVDAGMRELWRTGTMHNRVRMIAASFLTKNLRIHWHEGARWFWDTLVDANLANNTLGWQWVAGCGADAAPYFRVFNPVLQAEKFDPEFTYLRQWLPELAQLPDRWIAQPWAASEAELHKAGITLGETYPQPIVDLAASRHDALDAYAKMKGIAT